MGGPFLKGAACAWSYDRFVPAQRYAAENNGARVEAEDAAQVERLAFPAFSGLEEHPQSRVFLL